MARDLRNAFGKLLPRLAAFLAQMTREKSILPNRSKIDGADVFPFLLPFSSLSLLFFLFRFHSDSSTKLCSAQKIPNAI